MTMQNIALSHSFTSYYIILWISLSVVGVKILINSHRTPDNKIHISFPFVWWKIFTFLVATGILSAMAPIANDPTWDIPETIMMCSLTFLTAPWTTGIIYRAIVWYERVWGEIYVAMIMLLFSASWSYDLYVWIWQWIYPVSWSWNLMISPILYLCAWAFWSLEWRDWKWVIFSFQEKRWIMNNSQDGQLQKLLPFISLFLLLWIVIFWWFLYVNM